MKSNKILLSISLIFVAILFAFPLNSLAQGGSNSNNNGAQNQGSTFCSRIADGLSTIQQKMNTWEQKIKSKQGDIAENIESKRQRREDQLERTRIKWSENRVNSFQKLRERAQSEEEKEAVEKFIIAVEAAIKVRKEAFDKAIGEFKAEFNALVSSRQSTINQKTEEYKEAVSKAYEDAKTSCNQGSDLAGIQQSLRAALSQAKEQYRNKVRAAQNYTNEMQALAKEKKDLIKEATDVFHETIQEASQVLKSVFNEIE